MPPHEVRRLEQTRMDGFPAKLLLCCINTSKGERDTSCPRVKSQELLSAATKREQWSLQQVGTAK